MFWAGIVFMFGGLLCVLSGIYMFKVKGDKDKKEVLARFDYVNDLLRTRLSAVNSNIYDIAEEIKKINLNFGEPDSIDIYVLPKKIEQSSAIDQAPEAPKSITKSSPSKAGNTRPRTPEERAAASERMKKLWQEKRAQDQNPMPDGATEITPES